MSLASHTDMMTCFGRTRATAVPFIHVNSRRVLEIVSHRDVSPPLNVIELDGTRLWCSKCLFPENHEPVT